MEKLKPCPFCGGEAVLLEIPYGRLQAVRCNECGAVIRSAPSISFAIKAWNRRDSGWIKTSERLPEWDREVLGYRHDGFCNVIWWSGETWGYRDMVYKVLDYVDKDEYPYWMPLPELPEV